MASDKSENTIKFLRLYLLSSQTSLEVTKDFTKVTILPQYNDSFDKFLDDNKHVIYHLWKSALPCCVGNCAMPKSEASLSRKQFQLLFGLPDKPVPGHYIKNRQYCACGLMLNPSSLGKIDISLLCILIRKLCKLKDDEIKWLDEIRDIRNKLAHIENINEFDNGRLEKWWYMLEGSILGLAAKIPPATYYTDSVEHRIRLLKMSCFDVNNTASIINEFRRENTKLHDMVKEQHIQTRQSQAKDIEFLQHTIEELKDFINFKLDGLEFKVTHNFEKYKTKASTTDTLDVSRQDLNSTQRTVETQTDALGDKCLVEWRLQQPDSWKVEAISSALQGATQKLKSWFEVEFVYAGSIVIIASVSTLILNDLELLRYGVRSFLQELVKVCGLRTDKPEIIGVDLRIINETDVQRTKGLDYNKVALLEKSKSQTITDDQSTKDLDYCEDAVLEISESQTITDDQSSNDSDSREDAILGISKSQEVTEDQRYEDSDYQEDPSLGKSKLQEATIVSVESTIHAQCDLCRKLKKTTEASVRCFDCNESLCSDCIKIHQSFSISKDHKPIAIEDYHKLDQSRTAVKYECEQHKIKFDLLCVEHDTPICKKCVTENHAKCSDIKLLAAVTKNVKGSFAFTNLRERVLDLQVIVKDIINDLTSTLTKVKNETDRVISVIEATRKTVNEHLDSLNDEVLKQIKMQENDQKETTNKTLQNLQSLLTDLQEIENILEQVDRHASNFHTYCGIKQWNSEIENYEGTFSSLQKNLQSFDRFDVEVNKKVTNILTEIKSFASIERKYTSPAVKQLKKETHEQPLVNPDVHTDITLSKARAVTIPAGKEGLHICGCCIIESETMVFTDYYNKRLVHLEKGERFYEIGLTFHPKDIVKVDNETVAVTSKNDQKLVLVNFKQGKVVRTVYEGEECYGLCYDDENFVVGVGNKIKVINLDGKVLSTIDVENNATTCCVDENNLYYTASGTDTVYCCDMAGNVKWKYTCINGDFPHGITLDDKGDVLVACQEGKKVIKIDRDGKGFKVLLTEKDGMNKPKSITYSKTYNVLLVANCVEGKCFIYTIT